MERATVFADVIVPLGVPKLYTYRVPVTLEAEVVPGRRVLVQFGKSKLYTGIVHHLHEKAPADYTAKYIEAAFDEAPVVTSLQLRFWDWIGEYYCASPGEVMNAALPSALKLSSTSHVQLHPDFNADEQSDSLSSREFRLVEALMTTPVIAVDKVSEITGLRNAAVMLSKLIKRGVIVVFEEIQEKFRPKLVTYLRLSASAADEAKLQEILQQLEKRAFRQAEALMAFLMLSRGADGNPASEWIRRADVAKRSDIAAITALVKKGILEEREFETGRLMHAGQGRKENVLSELQTDVLLQVKSSFESGKPVLLRGVTGSGKTELYIKLIADALAGGGQVLYLVPEIALTTQLITRLRAVFGEAVGVYHSRFSEHERMETWQNILGQSPDLVSDGIPEEVLKSRSAKFKVIVGARSALFLPFSTLKLIIVDEEHDTSYKQQDPSPRYQARDSAIYLAHLHGARILLGSATPAIETYFNSQEGRYREVLMSRPYSAGAGTDVQICDVSRYESTNQMKAMLTPPLFEGVKSALARKSQVILFQNRRGFAPYTECRDCHHVPHCVQCDVALVYHKAREKLVCHYCGYAITPPAVCPACGSNKLHFRGLGTEKAEEEIRILFPEARIARMDLDSTRSKHAHQQLIEEFEAGSIDILVGTQMVTKGLDFASVDVVGILNADSMLNFPDFRSHERAFQLMTQVRGRAGRSRRGHVFIQTRKPDHPVLAHVVNGTLDQFYREVIAERKAFSFPPFSKLFELTVVSDNLDEVNEIARELHRMLMPGFEGKMLGPEFPMVARIRNRFHKRLLIKCGRTELAHARTFIREVIDLLHHGNQKWNFRVIVNADPY